MSCDVLGERMMSQFRQFVFVGILAGFALVSFTEEAQARGLVLITHGETVKYVADLPDEMAERIFKIHKRNLAVGYKYSAFGIFWLDLWTWDGEHCLFDGDDIFKVDEKQFEQIAGKPKSQFSKPWYYTFPPGLLVIAGIFAVSIPFIMKANARDKALQAKFEELIDDSRYQQALEILTKEDAQPEAEATDESFPVLSDESSPPEKEPETPTDEPFENAVQYLVDNGIDRDEAKENLILIVSFLAAQAEAEAAT